MDLTQADTVDWSSSKSHIFLNPRMPLSDKKTLQHILTGFDLPGHIFLATSGSTAVQSTSIKWVALKKSAFLISARSVNEHLKCTNSDVLLNALPHFHVGGLSVFARAYLSGAKVIEFYTASNPWDATAYVSALSNNKVTITSLVPTQVYDLVTQGLRAPTYLRAVVVGGGFLSEILYERAKQLGWPLLPSYGMTECCSQIATASPHFAWKNGYPQLTVLPHLKVSISPTGCLVIAGSSLLSGYILQEKNHTQFFDPKQSHQIITTDRGEFLNNSLFIYGREDENIKIKGENVSLLRLQEILEEACEINGALCECAIVALEDERQGHKIAAAFGGPQIDEYKIQKAIKFFNHKVFPFEQISQTHFMDEIPKTELKKIKRRSIADAIKGS